MRQPKVDFVLNCWSEPIELIKITTSVVDYQNVRTEEIINFKGVIQPLKAEQINIKPLETRSWKWFMIHTRAEIAINTNDKIEIDSKEYKVMDKNDYNRNGFYEYHIIESYE